MGLKDVKLLFCGSKISWQPYVAWFYVWAFLCLVFVTKCLISSQPCDFLSQFSPCEAWLPCESKPSRQQSCICTQHLHWRVVNRQAHVMWPNTKAHHRAQAWRTYTEVGPEGAKQGVVGEPRSLVDHYDIIVIVLVYVGMWLFPLLLYPIDSFCLSFSHSMICELFDRCIVVIAYRGGHIGLCTFSFFPGA